MHKWKSRKLFIEKLRITFFLAFERDFRDTNVFSFSFIGEDKKSRARVFCTKLCYQSLSLFMRTQKGRCEYTILSFFDYFGNCLTEITSGQWMLQLISTVHKWGSMMIQIVSLWFFFVWMRSKWFQNLMNACIFILIPFYLKAAKLIQMSNGKDIFCHGNDSFMECAFLLFLLNGMKIHHRWIISKKSICSCFVIQFNPTAYSNEFLLFHWNSIQPFFDAC